MKLYVLILLITAPCFSSIDFETMEHMNKHPEVVEKCGVAVAHIYDIEICVCERKNQALKRAVKKYPDLVELGIISPMQGLVDLSAGRRALKKCILTHKDFLRGRTPTTFKKYLEEIKSNESFMRKFNKCPKKKDLK